VKPLQSSSEPPIAPRPAFGFGTSRRGAAAAPIAWLLLLAGAASIGAQSNPPAENPPAAPAAKPKPAAAPTNFEELAKLVEAQRLLIEAQRKALAEQAETLAEQEKRLAQLEKQVAEASGLALSTHNELNELQEKAVDETVAQAVEARIAEVEESIQRVPEMAVKNLQGDFPGSFKIPGTDAALRIGGRVRMTYINSFDAIGSDDRFVASSIPIAGSEEAGKTSRVEFSVIPSRFNFDLRTPTGVGYVRAFIEADFAGSVETLRLRHAFGQWGRWLLGQAWSTFSDPEADPDGIDFEGLNAISLNRQPQIRWTRPLSENTSLAIAFEEANPDLTGAEGVNQVPDLVVRLRWDPEIQRFGFGLLGEGSHIQTALLVRQLRGETGNIAGTPQKTLSTEGYGINLSGVMPAPWAAERDRFRWAWNAGSGIGRYISDLRAEGGQDAFLDEESGELVPLDVAATYIAYEHWWSSQVRSTVTAGYVWLDNLDSQPADSLKRTERFSLNLAWSPIPRLDLVAEYLWGRRFDLDGQSGEAGQLQLGGTFRF
jgi:hypothetical protein